MWKRRKPAGCVLCGNVGGRLSYFYSDFFHKDILLCGVCSLPLFGWGPFTQTDREAVAMVDKVIKEYLAKECFRYARRRLRKRGLDEDQIKEIWNTKLARPDSIW